MFNNKEQGKLIQLNSTTFERLKDQHRHYNFDEDYEVSSYDDVIMRLIDFYEENH